MAGASRAARSTDRDGHGRWLWRLVRWIGPVTGRAYDEPLISVATMLQQPPQHSTAEICDLLSQARPPEQPWPIRASGNYTSSAAKSPLPFSVSPTRILSLHLLLIQAAL